MIPIVVVVRNVLLIRIVHVISLVLIKNVQTHVPEFAVLMLSAELAIMCPLAIVCQTIPEIL